MLMIRAKPTSQMLLNTHPSHQDEPFQSMSGFSQYYWCLLAYDYVFRPASYQWFPRDMVAHRYQLYTLKNVFFRVH